MKKIISYVLLMVTMVPMATVLTSCGDDEPETPNSPIVGTWRSNDVGEGWSSWVVFREDGTGLMADGKIDLSRLDDFGEFVSYTYNEEDQTVHVNLYDEDWSFQLQSITDDYFITDLGDDDAYFRFTRQTSPQASALIETSGQISKERVGEHIKYYVESHSGSCYFDITPVIFWHENLPPLTLKSATAKYDPIEFDVTGDNSCTLSVYYSANHTSIEKRSTIELRFANADNSVSLIYPITIHQKPAY